MTLYGEPEIWLEQFPLREPRSLACDHLGLRYRGEVIRADRWSSSWGAPLEGDTFFRVILLRQRRAEFSPDLRDSRIAVCLPGSGLSRLHSRLTAELATTRETQAVYLSQRDTQADLIRRTLQRRQLELEEQLLAEDSERYSDGRILTSSDCEETPASFFAGLDPATWFCRIAGWLLARDYPTLPINQEALPRPVTGDDASGLHQAIFQQAGAPPAILEQLGPGLGLSLPSSPGTYDPSQSRVFGLVRRRMASEPVPARWPDLFGYLTRDVGLTGHLATLFLLLYLHMERPEHELRLSPSRRLALIGGRPLAGTRLGGDLVPLLRWGQEFRVQQVGDQEIAGWVVSIGPATEPEWNDALPHLSTLSPGLAPLSVEQELQPQEQTLLRHLDALAAELAQAQELISLLERAQELEGQMGYSVDTGVDTGEDGGDLTASLGRLSQISGRDFRSIYHSVRGVYTDYRRLEEDLSLLHQLSLLGSSAEDILKAQEYLKGALVPPNLYPALSVDRQALGEALAPASLIQTRGRTWSVLEQGFSRFKSIFADAYRIHHEDLHQALPAFQRDLVLAHRKLGAMELLNSLAELGEPAGAGLSDSLSQLEEAPTNCTVSKAHFDLETFPWCSSCRLTLETSLPSAQLGRLLPAIDVALGAKNGQLSNLLVERIWHGQADGRLDDFLKIVQASDLSALATTLNQELLGFIRQLLA